MLEMVFSRVREDKVDDSRDWMEELWSREEEVLETFRNEGTRHERVFLLEGEDGAILVYVLEMDDPERAHRAYRDSKLGIDHKHSDVMNEVLEGRAEVEELLNLKASRGG